MALGKLLVLGRPTNLGTSRARAYSACSRCGWELFGFLSLVCHFSLLSPSLWETARHRLKYCLKGPLNPNQPTILQSCQGLSEYIHAGRQYENFGVYSSYCIYSVTCTPDGAFVLSSARPTKTVTVEKDQFAQIDLLYVFQFIVIYS